jgi:hypothetical protein
MLGSRHNSLAAATSHLHPHPWANCSACPTPAPAHQREQHAMNARAVSASETVSCKPHGRHGDLLMLMTKRTHSRSSSASSLVFDLEVRRWLHCAHGCSCAVSSAMRIACRMGGYHGRLASLRANSNRRVWAPTAVGRASRQPQARRRTVEAAARAGNCCYQHERKSDAGACLFILVRHLIKKRPTRPVCQLELLRHDDGRSRCSYAPRAHSRHVRRSSPACRLPAARPLALAGPCRTIGSCTK